MGFRRSLDSALGIPRERERREEKTRNFLPLRNNGMLNWSIGSFVPPGPFIHESSVRLARKLLFFVEKRERKKACLLNFCHILGRIPRRPRIDPPDWRNCRFCALPYPHTAASPSPVISIWGRRKTGWPGWAGHPRKTRNRLEKTQKINQKKSKNKNKSPNKGYLFNKIQQYFLFSFFFIYFFYFFFLFFFLFFFYFFENFENLKN